MPLAFAPRLLIGDGLVGTYPRAVDGRLRFEGPRPGAGWHRHDWRPRRLWLLSDKGLSSVVIERRRWREAGTTTTELNRCPDEAWGWASTWLTILLKMAAWLLSGAGLHTHEALASETGVPRTLQRWLGRLAGASTVLGSALRTAVIERSEPQPVERLFPSGVSPPAVIRRRRWKDPEVTYRLATGLVHLVSGAPALSTSATVLLAEVQKGARRVAGQHWMA